MTLEDNLTQRFRTPVEEADPPELAYLPAGDYGPFDVGEECVLAAPAARHTCCVAGIGTGSLSFQGSLDGNHWHTITTITVEAGADAHFAGTPPGDAHHPAVFCRLRAVPAGELTGGPFDIWFAST